MGKDLYKKPAVGRKVGTDRFRRTGRQDVLKKAQDLLFHIKRKSSTVKGKGWKPEKTLPGNDLLGADNTQKLLYISFPIFSILYNSISSLRWEGLIRRESQNWRTKSIPGRRFPVIIRCSEVRSSPEEADN